MLTDYIKDFLIRHQRIGNILLLATFGLIATTFAYFITQTYVTSKTNHEMLLSQEHIMDQLTNLAKINQGESVGHDKFHDELRHSLTIIEEEVKKISNRVLKASLNTVQEPTK